MNYNKGTLVKDSKGVWLIKWSDTNSFMYGTHWMYKQLSNNSNIIKYVENGEIRYKPLQEELEVDFKVVISHYDVEKYYAPVTRAKLVFPEVEKFEKEFLIKEYVLNGNPLFVINKIDVLRDGGTIGITTAKSDISFYIHKDNHTLHDQYPTTDENLVTDESTQVYVLDRIDSFKKRREHELEQINNLLDKLNQKQNENDNQDI